MNHKPDRQLARLTLINEMLEQMVNSSADGILLTDFSQTIIKGNQAIANIILAQVNELTETNLFTWLKYFDANSISQWVDLEQSLQDGKSSVQIELSIHNKQEIKFYEINASMLTSILNEEYGLIVSTWRDITKLKQNFQRQLIQSEEKFRLLAQHSIDWEYWFEKEGGFHYVSPACETVTGYTPEEFYRDKHLLQKIIHPDDFIKWKQHHALEFEQKPRDLIEFRILTKNQQLKYIEHRCTFIISDVGDFSGIRVSNRDISLRKAKEEEIKKLEELLSICSHCKKIRDEEGVWHQMEEYMSRRKNLSFSHGICKECMVKYYPEYL